MRKALLAAVGDKKIAVDRPLGRPRPPAPQPQERGARRADRQGLGHRPRDAAETRPGSSPVPRDAHPAGHDSRPTSTLGRAVFAKTCQQCHTLFGTGGKVGPELTGSNRADLDYVLSNVLDPSAVIGQGLPRPRRSRTADGRVLTGIVRERGQGRRHARRPPTRP